MLIVPAVVLFSKQLDLKDENNKLILQYIYGAVLVFVMTVYYYCYIKVNSKNEKKKIWVPPKPKPTLPFGLGPAPEPITIEEFEETTYLDYENKILREAVQSALLGAVISFFMSMKFGGMSLLIQSVLLPSNLTDNKLVKKYIFGVKIGENDQNIHGELLEKPTAAIVDAINKAAGTGAPGEAPVGTAIGANEPRVEELPDEPKEKTEKKEKK